MRQIVIPKDEAHWLAMRREVVTSTEISSLFGLSPYCTEFELFHRKKENLEVEFDPNARVIWGMRLQKSIADGVAEDNGFKIRLMNEFIYDDQEKLGSSFDYAIEEDGLLEVKNL